MARIIVDQLTAQTALILLECAFGEENPAFGPSPAELARHVLMQRGMMGHTGLVRINAGLRSM